MCVKEGYSHGLGAKPKKYPSCEKSTSQCWVGNQSAPVASDLRQSSPQDGRLIYSLKRQEAERALGERGGWGGGVSPERKKKRARETETV